MISIAELPTQPKYTIKAVSFQTGIRPVTIRAWERRYELLSPSRGDNRYRLYSEQDVALLQWVKSRLEVGISISTAVRELKDRLSRGNWPEITHKILPLKTPSKTRPPQEYERELLTALLKRNETTADEIFSSALAGIDLATLFMQVITPGLVKIGEAWALGNVDVVTEHFASNYLRSKLTSLLQSIPLRYRKPRILCGCAPTELHEIGILMISILLRQAGYRVEYLGQDIPLEDLALYIREENPSIVCLSASTELAARELFRAQARLTDSKSTPLFAYGGGAYNRRPDLRMKTPGLFLGENAVEVVAKIQQLV